MLKPNLTANLPFTGKENPLAPENLPRLEDLHPPYADLVKRRADLWARREAIEQSSRKLVEQMRTHTADGRGTERELSAIDRRAAELLGQAIPDQPSGNRMGDLERGYRDQLQEIAAINRAVEMLDPELRRERAVASEIFCAEIEAPYNAMYRRLIEAVLSAYEAAREFTILMDTMNYQDIQPYALNPVFPRFLNHGPFGDAGRYLAELVEAGWLTRDNLPKDLR